MTRLTRRWLAPLALVAAHTATLAAPPTQPLPVTLQPLDLQQVYQRTDRDGDETKWSVQAADGKWLRIETRRDGSIKELTSSDGQSLPESVLSRVLPAPVLNAPQRSELATLHEVDIDRDGDVELKGLDAQGRQIEIDFELSRDGQLREVKIERERPDTRRWSEPEVRERLEKAGYRNIDWLDLDSRDAKADATNAHGDRVEVLLDRNGQIERERIFNRVGG